MSARHTDSHRSHAGLLLGMNRMRISEMLDADVDNLATERCTRGTAGRTTRWRGVDRSTGTPNN